MWALRKHPTLHEGKITSHNLLFDYTPKSANVFPSLRNVVSSGHRDLVCLFVCFIGWEEMDLFHGWWILFVWTPIWSVYLKGICHSLGILENKGNLTFMHLSDWDSWKGLLERWEAWKACPSSLLVHKTIVCCFCTRTRIEVAQLVWCRGTSKVHKWQV